MIKDSCCYILMVVVTGVTNDKGQLLLMIKDNCCVTGVTNDRTVVVTGVTNDIGQLLS